ncbi:hypothetical protein [Mesorhizobium sp. Pch-S]|uniref:hypothetical protein n=1 Tax=Mesorhizobium sp. Pch-S TaxID=2082387 RepID=UPI001013164E|nr:hypothetical protein [Mesorhizobium sp. Pch-S]
MMEQTLRDLCAEHRLDYVSVSISLRKQRYCSVFLHWEGRCAHGSGATFDAALSEALADMAERRTARAA